MLKKIVLSILVGILITGTTYIYKNRIDYAPYADPVCSGNSIYSGRSELGACAPTPLYFDHHGFPWGYIAVGVYPNPNYRGDLSPNPLGLVADIAFWSTVSFGLYFGITKVRSRDSRTKIK